LQSGRQDALCKNENLEATRQLFIVRLLVATDLIVSSNESTAKGLTKCQRVVQLDSRIAHTAFDLRVSKQQLDCSSFTHAPT
jgi:hypothetical protein